MDDLSLALNNLIATGQLEELIAYACDRATARPPSRDQLAAMAMPGIISTYVETSDPLPTLPEWAAKVAAESYAVADAMIAARAPASPQGTEGGR
jgi:hypothetical protein